MDIFLEVITKELQSVGEGFTSGTWRGASSDLDLLDGGVDGLLDLGSLLLVSNDEGVEELAAADLELGGVNVLLDLDVTDVLAGADGEEPLRSLISRGMSTLSFRI